MKYPFSKLSLKGLAKAGDIIIPGQNGFPRFSDTDFIKHIGRMSDYMYEDDRSGFKLLMLLMGLMPSFMVRFILWVATFHNSIPGPLTPVLRQINIGVRGVIYTLYYSGLEDSKEYGEKILQQLKFDADIKTPLTVDTEMETLLTQNNPLLNKDIGPQDIPSVFEKARKACSEIAAMTVSQRLSYTERIRQVILKRQEEIIETIQAETHKCRTDILTSELFPIFEHLDFLLKSAESALKNETVTTPISMMGKKSEIWFESLGKF